MKAWTTTQAQIQGFELVHSNIYPIYDLLEHKETCPVVLWNSCRSSMAWGNSRIAKKFW